jgi:Las17-binding protein actin regulator
VLRQFRHRCSGTQSASPFIPKLTKAGFIIGGEHGNGVVSCRLASGWSAPAFIVMTGGSVGLQAGGEHQEIVLLMHDQGKQELTNGHWDLGAEAVAAGPTGDSAGVGQSTGWKAPVLSYSHSSGAYAELIFRVRRLIWIRTQTTICTDQARRSNPFWMGRHKRPKPRSSSCPRSNKLWANKLPERSREQVDLAAGLFPFA